MYVCVYIYIYMYIYIYIYIYIYTYSLAAGVPGGRRRERPPAGGRLVLGAPKTPEIKGRKSWGFLGAPYLGPPSLQAYMS